MKLAAPTLTLYSRRECHLCDDMQALLAEFSAEYHFSVDIQDVDSDPELFRRFNTLVPALYLNDKEICHYFLDLVALRNAINSE